VHPGRVSSVRLQGAIWTSFDYAPADDHVLVPLLWLCRRSSSDGCVLFGRLRRKRRVGDLPACRQLRDFMYFFCYLLFYFVFFYFCVPTDPRRQRRNCWLLSSLRTPLFLQPYSCCVSWRPFEQLLLLLLICLAPRSVNVSWYSCPVFLVRSFWSLFFFYYESLDQRRPSTVVSSFTTDFVLRQDSYTVGRHSDNLLHVGYIFFVFFCFNSSDVRS